MDTQSQQWNSVPESGSEAWADIPEVTTEAWSDQQYFEASTELPVYSDNVEMITEAPYDQSLYQEIKEPVPQENLVQDPVSEQGYDQMQLGQNHYNQEENHYQETGYPHEHEQQEEGQDSAESSSWFQSPSEMVRLCYIG